MNSSNANPNETAIYIDGKAQAIQILRLLEPEEKARLLQNMKIRNPEMTMELSEKSLSFKNVEALSNHELKLLTMRINPQIIGISLRESNINFQRRVLSIMDRSKAEMAYNAMFATINNEKASIAKARERIIDVAVALNRNKLIRFM